MPPLPASFVSGSLATTLAAAAAKGADTLRTGQVISAPSIIKVPAKADGCAGTRGLNVLYLTQRISG